VATLTGRAGATFEVVIDDGGSRLLAGAEREADLIVVAGRLRRQPPDLPLGKVADTIARDAPCSVLVVREP
jgi:nucleotide-binding universal stress UspA family protein